MQGFGKEWWCVWSLEKKEKTPERVIRSGVFSFGCLTGRSVLRRYKGIADGVSRCRIAPSEGWRRIG